MSGSGETITFKQLDERSNRIAHALRAAGCAPGDTIAIFAENSPRYFEICWAAQRAGLYYVAVSSRLTTPEVAYIIEDSGAKLLIASAPKGSTAKEVKAATGLKDNWSSDGDIDGFPAKEPHFHGFPARPTADQTGGRQKP